jgi:uncharacterized protein (TIRG00374 family)
MKKLHAFLFTLGLAFVILLIWRTGIRQLWQQLTLPGWGLIPIIIAEGLAEVFHAISWRYCLSASHRHISLLRLFRIHFAGYALNFLTPTASLAGEVTKAALLAAERRGPEAVSAVIVGKLSAGLGHLVFVAAGSIFLLPILQLPPALRITLLSSTGLLTAGIVIFLLLQRHGKLAACVRWFTARGVFARTMQPFVLSIERLDDTLKAFHRDRPWDFARSVFWHLPGHALGIFATWYFLSLLGADRGGIVAARIWCLILWFDLVTFAVPLGLGVLEGGRLIAFRAFGFSALPGLTFGLLTRGAQLFWAAFGLINYAFMIRRTEPSVRTDRPYPEISPSPALHSRALRRLEPPFNNTCDRPVRKWTPESCPLHRLPK